MEKFFILRFAFFVLEMMNVTFDSYFDFIDRILFIRIVDYMEGRRFLQDKYKTFRC